VQQTGADTVIAMGGVPSNAGIIKELRTLGNDAVYVMANPQHVMTMSMVAGGAGNIITLGALPEADGNTQKFLEIYARYADMFGEEAAQSFTANSCNSLYILLQMMSIGGTTDVDSVMSTWQSQDKIDTLYGEGPVCGEQTMGSKRAVASPPGKCVLKDDGIPTFLGFAQTYIP